MDFFDVLLGKKLSGGGGSKPSLVPWTTGTDDEIVAMVNGYYSGALSIDEIKSVWSVGDCRSINLSAMAATYVGESHRAQTVELQILDFEHDDLTTAIGEKAKALITVDLKDCLRDATVADNDGSHNSENGYFNSTDTNIGSWKNCARRQWSNEIFYNALPSYIKNIVKKIEKSTSAGNMIGEIFITSDYCFFLSEVEIYGNAHYSFEGEGNQYKLFGNDLTNLYKLPKWSTSASSVTDSFWERSPIKTNSTFFCRVLRDGTSNSSPANENIGIAPAFCL